MEMVVEEKDFRRDSRLHVSGWMEVRMGCWERTACCWVTASEVKPDVLLGHCIRSET